MEDMLRHFETRILQRSQFTNQDSQPFINDDHVAHLDDTQCHLFIFAYFVLNKTATNDIVV